MFTSLRSEADAMAKSDQTASDFAFDLGRNLIHLMHLDRISP